VKFCLVPQTLVLRKHVRSLPEFLSRDTCELESSMREYTVFMRIWTRPLQFDTDKSPPQFRSSKGSLKPSMATGCVKALARNVTLPCRQPCR